MMGGFEWGTGVYINPTAPEDAAELLRVTRG
jgi:galactose-1-phosphate uridylyltransferase